jgi:hypothetical protein
MQNVPTQLPCSSCSGWPAYARKRGVDVTMGSAATRSSASVSPIMTIVFSSTVSLQMACSRGSSEMPQPAADLNHCLSSLSSEIAATGACRARRAKRVIRSKRSSIGV